MFFFWGGEGGKDGGWVFLHQVINDFIPALLFLMTVAALGLLHPRAKSNFPSSSSKEGARISAYGCREQT